MLFFNNSAHLKKVKTLENLYLRVFEGGSQCQSQSQYPTICCNLISCSSLAFDSLHFIRHLIYFLVGRASKCSNDLIDPRSKGILHQETNTQLFNGLVESIILSNLILLTKYLN